MDPRAPALRRLRIEIRGAVQGVGFRPFVYRTATAAGLDGWVVNDLDGVRIEVEGSVDELDAFVRSIRSRAPTNAVMSELRTAWLEPVGFDGFAIRESRSDGAMGVSVLPDLATCPACRSEILDPADRRHRYAFTNCTECGPRFSIVRDLPYDRPFTTMAGFVLCEVCDAEYEDPSDRRFHAQPNACPDCGPALRFSDGTGGDPIERAAAAIRKGRIVALKGLGGFHLVCDAADEEAVTRLRARKRRPTRPFAVMVPDVRTARALCEVSAAAADLLEGPAAPIVLLRRRRTRPGEVGGRASTPPTAYSGAHSGPHSEVPSVAPSVAPGASRLGLFLPYTPLHHLLLEAVGRPVVATSGNLSDEPICTGNGEARARLGDIADDLLLHDRPIERPVDDSVVAELGGAPVVLRRSRGFAPLPVPVADDLPELLAVGAQQKNAVALSRGTQVWTGAHVGDLDAPEAQEAFRRSVADLCRLFRVRPVALAHDLHPDYASTRWATEWTDPAPRIAVQHHHAHLASVLAEHGWTADGPPALGIVWDGTGLGTDGTIWGGEFLLGNATSFRRVAHLRTFRLPGGEAAVRDPRRVALSLLAEAGADGVPMDLGRSRLPADRIDLFSRMIDQGISAPVTSSAGRLFDGVAALLGLVETSTWEGEPAVALEEAAVDVVDDLEPLPFVLVEGAPGTPITVDWAPAIRALLRGLDAGVSVDVLAARFHTGLVVAAARVAEWVGARHVALSGGCMQNARLVNGLVGALAGGGHRPLVHRVVPPNDGGIALGQILVAGAHLRRTAEENPSHDSGA